MRARRRRTRQRARDQRGATSRTFAPKPIAFLSHFTAVHRTGRVRIRSQSTAGPHRKQFVLACLTLTTPSRKRARQRGRPRPADRGPFVFSYVFCVTCFQEAGHRSFADKLGARFGLTVGRGQAQATLWRLTDAPINVHGDLVTKGMFQISRCSGRTIIPPPGPRSHGSFS
ncbi:hypothetical protein BD626DRAFT_60452 [Schizophyllum amplum]|uniref:Uncharacterized protein n=1 Tax=Schizophyllum amplum TaxID=97359 RepID=A0A550CC71_9AGAR|nr:hypothetical protein BD626DRAFT_60452 [Auriculariopsis ampla]